ncbi:MAG: hypothetical protein FWB78_04060 [Treponema sp.]|nr:hypothetical protein [Treponema sp.]
MKKAISTIITVCCAVLILLLAVACTGRRNETPVLPPETSPLSQTYIGYGVVNVLYTRLSVEATAISAASGHARMGTVVRIHERRLIRDGARTESWLLVEEDTKGWILEELVDVYANEQQARTASETMR